MSASLRSFFQGWPQDIKQALFDFFGDGHVNHAAALSFYALFSLPSMTMLSLSAAEAFYQADTAKQQVYSVLEELIGSQAAHLLSDNLESMSRFSAPSVSAFLGLGALLISASSVFSTLQQVLNQIFGAHTHESSRHAIFLFLQRRLISLALVLLIGLILLASISADAILGLLSGWMADRMPLAADQLPWIASTGISLGSLWVLNVLFFRVLPDAKIPWGDCISGAFLSAILFAIARTPMRLYMSNTHPENVYHAAGGIILMMLWIYCASSVFLLCALFTHKRCVRHNSLSTN